MEFNITNKTIAGYFFNYWDFPIYDDFIYMSDSDIVCPIQELKICKDQYCIEEYSSSEPVQVAILDEIGILYINIGEHFDKREFFLVTTTKGEL